MTKMIPMMKRSEQPLVNMDKQDADFLEGRVTGAGCWPVATLLPPWWRCGMGGGIVFMGWKLCIATVTGTVIRKKFVPAEAQVGVGWTVNGVPAQRRLWHLLERFGHVGPPLPSPRAGIIQGGTGVPHSKWRPIIPWDFHAEILDVSRKIPCPRKDV